jgi:hypothetical protein
MGRTERSFLAASIAALLVLSAATAAAAPAASGGTSEPTVPPSGSATAFAERIAAGQAPATGARAGASLQSVLELIVLAAVCAIGVAFYSSASGRRDAPGEPPRLRRR